MMSNNLYKILLIIILIQVFSEAQARDSFFRTYKNLPTAPVTNIQTITQNRDGFIWLGTEDNLYRFDGKQFVAADSEFKLLDISRIHCSKDDLIWINSIGKLYVYDCKSGRFRKDFPDERFSDLNWFQPFEEDINGDMWFCQGTDSIGKYNFSTNKLQMVAGNGFISPHKEYVFTYHPTEGSIIKHNILTGKSDAFHNKSIANLQDVISMHAVSDSQIIINTSLKHLYLYNVNRSELKKHLNSRSSCFARMDESKYLIGGEGGIFILDISRGEITEHIQHDRYNPNSLHSNSTSSLFCDAEGGVWVGSWYSGLSYKPKRRIVFETHYINHPNFRGKTIGGICEDSTGHLWIATQEGVINRISKSTGQITNFPLDQCFTNAKIVNSLSLKAFGSELWVGTYDSGIIVLDTESGQVKRVETPLAKSQFKSIFIRDFNQTRDGSIFVNTRRGVLKYNKERTAYTDYYPQQLDSGCVKIFEDLNNRIWALTEYYVYCIETNGNIRQVDISNRGEISDLKMFMNDIIEDHNGRLWLATTNGLALYDTEKKCFTIRKFGVDPYLNSIFRMELDDFGQLWCSTKRGLVSFSKSDFSDKVVYSGDEGISESRFNHHSSYKEPNSGRVWFGSTDGVVSFIPQKSEHSESQFAIQFTNISYLESIEGANKMVNYDLSSDEVLSLEHSRRYINFEFITPSYASTDVNYYYRLEELGQSSAREDYWIGLDKSNQVSFQNLSAGIYTLRVRSLLSANKQESQTSFKFRVMPPVYASIGAYIIYIILFAGGIFGFVYLYTRRERQKRAELNRMLDNERQKELFNAKINFFTYVTHEIRTPLSLIKIPLENILHNLSGEHSAMEKELRLIAKNTDALTNLCTQLLDFRKMEGDCVQLSYVKIDVVPLLNEIVYMFTPSIESKKIKLDLKIPTSEMFVVIDKGAFSKMTNNLINNAVKYCCRYVSVELRASEDSFSLIVSSDGALISKDERQKIFTMYYRSNSIETGTGIGLPLCRQLAEMHDGSLTLEVEEKDALNIFILKLPIDHRNVLSSVVEFAKEDNDVNPILENGSDKDGVPVVFVVEDNKELRAYLKQYLSKHYQVIVSKSANDAIQKLRKYDVSIIISDLMMPGMNGIEFCKIIKSELATSQIPFILLTANTLLETKLESMNCGADDYIEKPFSMSYLHARIDNILHQRAALYSEFTKKPLVKFTISPGTNNDEQQFVERITSIIEREYANSQLDMSLIADELKMSKATLYRKVKKTLNINLADFIIAYRLQRAAELLKQTDMRINEVAFMTGFSSATYFTTSFHRQFGLTPSEFSKQYEGRALE